MRRFFNAAIKNPVSIAVIALFATFLIWWIWLHYFITNVSSNTLGLWADLYQVVALFGAIFGFIASSRWGGFKSFIGRAIIAFSFGLFFQFFGNLSYSYYIHYLHIEVPYPSVGDIGFFGSALFYIYGAFMLARASQIKLSLKLIGSKIYVIIISVTILVLSYLFFLQGYSFDWSNPIKIFLDFVTPLIGVIPIPIALLAFHLSQQKLGGALKIPIISFILALGYQYLSDFVFIYQANNGIGYSGGFNDLMYAISYILMAFSLILLSIWPSLLSD